MNINQIVRHIAHVNAFNAHCGTYELDHRPKINRIKVNGDQNVNLYDTVVRGERCVVVVLESVHYWQLNCQLGDKNL